MPSYSAYGLTFSSELELPDLPLSGGEAQAAVRLGVIEVSQPAARAGGERFFQKLPQSILLCWRDYARFLVTGGREILVEPVDDAPGSVIRHLLMGPVFSVLNFQRGMAIFHASAVALPEGAAAFMGGKGHGKSTQAAALVQAGGQLITDDLLALQPRQTELWAAPGVPFLKLWPEAVAHLGGDPASLPLVKDNLEKRTLPLQNAFTTQPVALSAVFLLELGQQVEIERISTREALRRILPHWYGSLFDGELLPVLGMERQFWDCTTLVQRLPVYSLKRPIALERLPEICQAVRCVL